MLLAVALVLTLSPHVSAYRPPHEQEKETQDGALALVVGVSARHEQKMSKQRHLQNALTELAAELAPASGSGAPAHWGSFDKDHEAPVEMMSSAGSKLETVDSESATRIRDSVQQEDAASSRDAGSSKDPVQQRDAKGTGQSDRNQQADPSSVPPTTKTGIAQQDGPGAKVQTSNVAPAPDAEQQDRSRQSQSQANSDSRLPESKRKETHDAAGPVVEGHVSTKKGSHDHEEPKKDDAGALQSLTSPIDILLGVRADHAPFPDDGNPEVLSEIDHAIFDVQEIARVMSQMYDRIARFSQSLVSRNWYVAAVVYATSMFLMLGLYSLLFRYRDVESDLDFHFGLLECAGDVRICVYGLVCAPIRWADTLQKAGLANFLPAFFVMWLLLTLRFVLFHFFTWGCVVWLIITIVGVVFRQKIRNRCALEKSNPQSYIEDFFAWCCCAEFAVCQEARQVEAMLQQDSF